MADRGKPDPLSSLISSLEVLFLSKSLPMIGDIELYLYTTCLRVVCGALLVCAL